ncbi:TonB-dependent receptor plug domain-containing protein [Sphingomonas oryzagri]|uniref:TonB-dependent receptor n=1 Tax=Sphingomonas oryzagri TaxID=3042314 RepID=A0ABT6N245_9SPHN|nr:TonB-dependent receptor [Sphingomonas oryzagri]MDH7639320.1 TonB-dependent receptor [Sphingomonas oryzagri]
MKTQSNMLRLLAGVSALTMSSAAFAQAQATSAPPAETSAAADSASSAPAPAAEIVVTGSRVIKNGSASPTPLTTVSTQALAVASPAGTISDALNNLPVFSGSRNSYSNPGSNATGVQGGNGNANVLNLRNLGTYRTLVLFDGHRIPPTLFNSTVDVDLIPQELIDRVDVVTGGVSAVYGSDAVSGVVNYILNNKFDGFRAHVEGGVSQRGDAGNQDIGGAFGTKVGDRGHFEVSAQHREYDGILDRAYDRSWDNLAAIEGAGTAANPYQLLTNVRLSTYSFGGFINGGALNGMTFNQNGVLSTFNKGTATGSSCCQVGGDGAYQDASMASPSKSTQAFGRFDYDLTDDIHVYVQGALNLKKSVSYTGWNQLAGITMGADNAYLDPVYQAELAAAGQSTFKLNEILQQAPRIQNISKTTQWYVNTGIDGHLGGFKWEATYSHGSSRMKTQVNNQVNLQRLTAAADAVKDGNGNIVCAASLSDPSAYGNCSPIDLFGPSAASAQSLAYVLGSTGFVTHTIQDSADASISGSLFDTWAGPVNVALSGEWRRQSFDAQSFGQTSAYVDCTDLRYCSTTTKTPVYASTFPDSPTVSQSVKEAAIEVDVPLLKDKPFAKSFDVNGAARYTDYSTSGHYATWKVGAVWAINDQLKLRGTLSRDIRAPTLYDLFQPTTTVYGNFTDVSKGVTAYVPSVNIGNPNLTSEVGHTYTLGAVLKPHFVPGLTLTVDYYHTLVTNAISVIQGFNAAVQQGCIQSGGASVYCSLIQRDAAGNATAYYIQPENIARVKTYGWDGEADYSTRIGEHPLNLRLLVNYQPHIYYQQPGIPTIDQGDAGWGLNGLMPSPSVQIAGFVDFKPTDNFTIDLFEHWRNKFRRSGVASQVFADPYVKSYATTNLTLTFDTGSAWVIKDSQFYLSVTNLFDAKPPLSGYYSGSTAAGQSYEFSDDPTGRAFLVGFRIKG